MCASVAMGVWCMCEECIHDIHQDPYDHERNATYNPDMHIQAYTS